MRKSDKKLDNELRTLLTKLCENELEGITGFQWLTHSVQFTNVQSSLKIVCVFDTNINLEIFLSSNLESEIESKIHQILTRLNIKVKNAAQQILFDTEKNCARLNKGNWAKRLA